WQRSPRNRRCRWYSSARLAQAKLCLPTRSTTHRCEGVGHSLHSTPRQSATRCSRASCSVMSAGPSPARSKASKENLNWRTLARCFWRNLGNDFAISESGQNRRPFTVRLFVESRGRDKQKPHRGTEPRCDCLTLFLLV